eukprot:TRINITY_DN744_c0_g2_i2.p1 TRINITY_DN744_c0_g2~~TRINITY_DN744_c0_g2_i2.p1  ORF type:complete len:300 (-),score=53.34 TRINITY_DN744_c0_g2_i2:521-1420(-)
MQSESPSSDTHEIYNDYGAALEHDQIPIIYHDAVNIGFWGLEKLQPFDTKKYRRIRDTLARDFSLKLRQFPTTKRVPSHAELSLIHTSEYLEHIGTSYGVARVCEFPLISFFPYSMTHSKVVLPMKTAMAGTILASHFAMQRGWAINLGGGFHHSAPESASGWCMFGDIPYSWIVARSAYPQLQRAMYIDFDVHQGNGFERLWINDPSVYIVDAYNSQIFPGDTYAKRAIHQKLEFPSGIQDGPYLELISRGLEKVDLCFSFVTASFSSIIFLHSFLFNMNCSFPGIQSSFACYFFLSR